MLLHILKKDLKKKRTMNVILLLFIIMASAFLAASMNNLLTIAGAVDHFLEISKAPDYLAIVLGTEEDKPIDSYLKECTYVTEYEELEMYTLMEEDVAIILNDDKQEEKKFESGSTVAVGVIPENFMKVFDEEGEELTLKSGEIAIPKLLAVNNELAVGDKIRIDSKNGEMEFTISVIAKDAIMGSEMMGFKRLFICEEDYKLLTKEDISSRIFLYGVNCSDVEAFQKAFHEKQFRLISEVQGSLFPMLYVFDMLIAGILIIVSVCLILISFLILRFTIVFTLQEDYKEIGIMKAVGIKEVSIRGIYLVKYFAIAIIGSIIGLAFSFPLEKLLLSQALNNLVLEELEGRVGVNIACALMIVILVLLFCYGSTGKVKRFTVMEAIRSGNNGERYQARNVFSLYKRKKMPAFVYLACNDVTGSIKRYLVLAAIFLIGTLEILIPLAALHTLKDEEIIRTMSMQSCDLFLDNGSTELYITEKDREVLAADLIEIKEELKENGIEAEVWMESNYMIPCYGTDEENIVSVRTMQQTGRKTDDYDMLEGQLPILANEVAITEILAEELEVSIGDSIYYQFPEKEAEFLVTGIYQSMMDMGRGLRVSKDAELPFACMSGGMAMQIKAAGNWEKDELLKKVQEIFPSYEITTSSEYMDGMIGGITESMDALKYLITMVVLVINILISVLTMKTLITRERGEIAMLKSIGFSNRTLKAWQSTRILLVLTVAILSGTVLAKVFSPVILGPIFAMMGGTQIKLVTNPIEAYVVYPLVLLIVTGIASYLCAFEVTKVDLKEINTLE